jgi:hypothetical protein
LQEKSCRPDVVIWHYAVDNDNDGSREVQVVGNAAASRAGHEAFLANLLGSARRYWKGEECCSMCSTYEGVGQRIVRVKGR